MSLVKRISRKDAKKNQRKDAKKKKLCAFAP
jgi:hypothetical protein